MNRSVSVERWVRSFRALARTVWLCAALSSGGLVAQAPPGALFTGTPAEQLAAARARLDAFGSYRETREYSEPRRFVQMVEFSGKLQRWISEQTIDGQTIRQETIWDGGRSARRELPDDAEWMCAPPLPDRFLKPEATVRDGGTFARDGRTVRRLIEEFENRLGGGKVTHETDIDVTTGVPVHLRSIEENSSGRTIYDGTYHDLGVPITIVFPACQ